MAILTDAICDACGRVEDLWYRSGEPLMCPICKSSCRRIFSYGGISGPTETKPLYVHNMNRSFSSQKELDAFARSRGLHAVSNKDPQWRDMEHGLAQDIAKDTDRIWGSEGKFLQGVKERQNAKRK